MEERRERSISMSESVSMRGRCAAAFVMFALVVVTWCCNPTQAFASDRTVGDSEAGLAAALSTQASSNIYSSFDSADYTGSAVVPTHKVYTYDDNFNDVILTEGTDYTVAYSNNVNVGKATVTVSGKGKYAGLTTTNSFNIWERSLSDAAVVAAPMADLPFNGAAQMPEPTLSIGSYTLKKGVDYQIDSYYGNVNAGSASIWCKGIGNFSGLKDIPFVITQVPIDNATFVIADQEYTGWTVEPTPDASWNGIELEPYSDFTVTYRNNRNIGVAEAVITGSGNYVGQRVITFNITKAANSLAVTAASKSISVKGAKSKAQKVPNYRLYRLTGYDGSVTYKKVSATAKGSAAKKAAKKIKVNAKTGDITMPKGSPKGTYTVKVKVTAKGDANHNKASKTVTLKLKL